MNPSTQHQAQKQVLERAQQGDPAVICGLLNHKFEPEGITPQVVWQSDDRLSVTLTAEHPPNAAVCLQIIERGFKRLAIPQLVMVEVTAYQQGQERPLWRQQLSLTTNVLAIDLAAWLESGSSLQSAVVNLPTPTTPQTAVTALTPLEPEQRYLSFTLGIANPGLLAVEAIQEILYITLVQLLPVPDMSDCVVGIHNWRGEMLWIVDLNHLLGLGGLALETLDTVAVIVIGQGDRTIGLMVRTVGEILPYNPGQLQPPNGLFAPELEPFIAGYLRESSSIVLNTATIFNAPELRHSRS
ncbi:MAG: hypothetical protein F6J87_15725 [Spirulina sp. SIO3F2]|nr:hypothetical protein [Spirulina sp. SIO3F2]